MGYIARQANRARLSETPLPLVLAQLVQMRRYGFADPIGADDIVAVAAPIPARHHVQPVFPRHRGRSQTGKGPVNSFRVIMADAITRDDS